MKRSWIWYWNVKDPATWNPLELKSTDVYKNTSLASIRKKILLKEVELTIKIEREATQIVGLNVFTIEDLAKFKKYASDKKYSYIHFGGIRIGLAPLFWGGINTPTLVELFDSRHVKYEHAMIGSIIGNLISGCQFGTIYPNHSLSLLYGTMHPTRWQKFKVFNTLIISYVHVTNHKSNNVLNRILTFIHSQG